MPTQHRSSSPPTFPIPTFPPLLRIYNAPAPVIDPPRSHLCSVSNPSFHRYQMLSPMDVDPCIAVSRSEIGTKLIVLTESEHAGVPLSEPATMASTESEIKHTNFMVFDVPCASEKVVDRRVKIAQNGTVSFSLIQETTSAVANDTLNQDSGDRDLEIIKKLPVSVAVQQETPKVLTVDRESEKKNQVLFVCSIPKVAAVQAGGTSTAPIAQQMVNAAVTTTKSENRTTFACDVCNITCDSQKGLKKHIKAKKHQNELERLTRIQKTPATVTNQTSDQNYENLKQDLLRKQALVNELSNVPSKKVAIGSSCGENLIADKAVCYDWCNNLKFSEKNVAPVDTTPTESNSIWCDLCRVDCTSRKQYEEHISGKKHMKNVKMTERSPSPSTAPAAKCLLQDQMMKEDKDVISETSKRMGYGNLLASADVKRQRMIKEDHGEEVDGTLTCKVCSVICKGYMAYNAHVATREHSAMALKQVIGG